ncbi:hypothetical protein [Neobacillus sp. YIM B06451]|uniref:hypothetical protein n=1 Tax=Neobacillus sp. YIM B06451 TaxID=3070994 RepID=UPI00292CEE35|nr:hypothetical protein [Neobacillus sp. YIM B06451]
MANRSEMEKEFKLKWFDIVLTEYDSLRNESANALQHQQSIINYGLTAIGVLIAFGANLWAKDHIVESLFIFFIPFLCNLIILIWNGEVRRMSRAGQYIKLIEDKINLQISKEANIPELALEWETYLRRPKKTTSILKSENWLQRIINSITSFFSFLFKDNEERNNKIKSNYIAIIIMFGVLSILSIFLGFGNNYSIFFKNSSLTGVELFHSWVLEEFKLITVYVICFVIDIFCFIYHYRYFNRVKK